jgi:hypothetical protein
LIPICCSQAQSHWLLCGSAISRTKGANNFSANVSS